MFPELHELRKLSEENYIPIIRRDTEEYLFDLIKRIKPQRILEIGTAVGYSALFFKLACPKAEVYSIERDPYVYEIALSNINKIGDTRDVNVLLGDGINVLDKMIAENVDKFDLIFIDAGKSHYKEFMDRAIKLSRIGTYILSDDIMQRGEALEKVESLKRKHRTNSRNMIEYIDYLENLKTIKTQFLSIGDGLAVSHYIG